MVTKVKLLVVDGRDIFREGLVKLLKNKPAIEAVYSCKTGIEAAENAYKHQPDVILLDTELTDLNSVDVVKRILEGLPNTCIIMLTHSEAYEHLVLYTEAGAKGYLSKDVSFERLFEAIILVAAGWFILSPPMGATRIKVTSLDYLEESKDTASSTVYLSKREKAVLDLVKDGLTNKEIAHTLFISENTVKVHMRNIMEKSRAHTRQQAVNFFKSVGYTT